MDGQMDGQTDRRMDDRQTDGQTDIIDNLDGYTKALLVFSAPHVVGWAVLRV